MKNTHTHTLTNRLSSSHSTAVTTPLEPQSRFGDKPLKILSNLSPKRDCGPKKGYTRVTCVRISLTDMKLCNSSITKPIINETCRIILNTVRRYQVPGIQYCGVAILRDTCMRTWVVEQRSYSQTSLYEPFVMQTSTVSLVLSTTYRKPKKSTPKNLRMAPADRSSRARSG